MIKLDIPVKISVDDFEILEKLYGNIEEYEYILKDLCEEYIYETLKKHENEKNN